jgi:hypothetical protein
MDARWRFIIGPDGCLIGLASQLPLFPANALSPAAI